MQRRVLPMDSVSTRPRLANQELTDEPGSAAPSRLTRLVPAARAAVRVAWRTALAGALGAAAVWTALFEQMLAAGTVPWTPALLVAAVLLVPAAAATLLAWTLDDLLNLPDAMRAALGDVRPATRERGVGGLFRTVWALRALAFEGAGAWARTAGLVRLASLPFVAGLLGLVALNAVVVAAGAVALAALVL